MMTPSEVIVAVDREIRWSSEEYHNDNYANHRHAWEYFKGESPRVLDEDVHESFQEVVSRDVADTIEATLAEIIPAFASDRPAEFDQIGPGDDDAAILESDICNDILMEAGSGFLELTTAAKDALLLRIGALEIIWDDSVEVEYQEASLPLSAIGILSQRNDVEITPLDTYLPSSSAIPVQIKTYKKKNVCRVESVPPDELLISSDCKSMDLDRARFVARDTLISRSDLIASGYDRRVVNELPPYTTVTEPDRAARSRNSWGREKKSGHRATDLIRVVRAYYRLDEDEDGIAELRRVVVAGRLGAWNLLEDYTVSYQPFASGAAYIWPHQPYGISFYDKLKQVQDMKTRFWRIMLEAGSRAARDRVGLGPGVDLDDWESTTFGGGVKMPTKDSILPIPNNHFPGELNALQAFADKARREGGGGAVDKSSSENMPVEAGAHGVERFLSAIEELNSMVARLIAETLVRGAYLKIHSCLRLYSPPMKREINGEWLIVDPSQWTPRNKVTVAVGLTLSERNRQAQALGLSINRQMELLEKGSILANEDTLYSALSDQLRMLGVSNPGSYYINPKSQEGQRASQNRQQDKLRQEQMRDQQMQAQQRLMLGVEQSRNTTKLQQQDMKDRASLRELLLELRADQKQESEKLRQQYDALRVKLVEIEAKYGPTENPIESRN